MYMKGICEYVQHMVIYSIMVHTYVHNMYMGFYSHIILEWAYIYVHTYLQTTTHNIEQFTVHTTSITNALLT